MAQFDVYANPNRRTRQTYPLLLNIQSDQISALSTRLVAPMARKADLGYMELTRLTPSVSHEGDEFLVLIPQLAALPARELQQPIGTLIHMRDEVIAALDFAITGI